MHTAAFGPRSLGPWQGWRGRGRCSWSEKTAATSLRPPELDVAPPPCLAPGAMAPQRPQIQFQPPSPDSFPVQAVVMQQPLISSLAPAARLPISNSLLSGPPTGTKQPTSGVVQDIASPIHCLPPTPHDETGARPARLPCIGGCQEERERAGWTDTIAAGLPDSMRLMSSATVCPPRERRRDQEERERKTKGCGFALMPPACIGH